MDNEKLVEILSANLARQLDWIKMADSKATFTFGFAVAMLGALAGLTPKPLIGLPWTTVTFLLASAVFLCISGVFSWLVTFPRTSGPLNSLIYCGEISKLKIDAFRGAMSTLTIDDYIRDLSDQCHRNAEIATVKLEHVRRAAFFLYIASAVWTCSIWILYSGPARQAVAP